MRHRRLGRIGHESSVLIFGAAALADVTQDVADVAIDQALEAGINHFDVAASYGDAELRLGPRMSEMRSRIFLATKTGEREAGPAWAQINASLERLQTDHIDLIQVHAVGDLTELDKVTGPGGALESALRARDEGLVSWVGITGHGHQAPATHLEALRRFSFDSVLTPLNWVLAQDADFLADHERLVEEAQRQDTAMMNIKSISRRNWPDDGRPYTTWYEPFDEQETIDAAVAWALGHPQFTGIATAGDVTLLPRVIEAERRTTDISVYDAETVLRRQSDFSSPFIHSI